MENTTETNNENALVFVDLTNKKTLKKYKDIVEPDVFEQHIQHGIKYLLFNIETTEIVMYVGNDNNVISNDNNSIKYVGLDDLEVIEKKDEPN